MFHFNDAPEGSKKIFVRLIDIFEEHKINPTPLNYYVWYQYLKGGNREFHEEMESIVNDPYGYNDRAGKRLFDEYLAEEPESTNEFDRAFRRLVNLVIKKINAWSDKLEQHTQELDDCATSLANPDIDTAELKQVAKTMMQTAQAMNESSQSFQKEMIMNSEEVKRLRTELIEAQTAAMIDELTEVGNRKAFNIALQELMLEFESEPNSLCLILADIDHFKSFNDTYGHLIGDSVLRYFANILKKEQGKNATVCRYGGEEFAILLTDSSIEEAAERAESIRSAIESATLRRKNAKEPLKTVTASFGIAHYHGEEDSDEAFITRADEALYEAKRAGRNRIVDEIEMSRPSIA